jgi:hypothetical protein
MLRENWPIIHSNIVNQNLKKNKICFSLWIIWLKYQIEISAREKDHFSNKLRKNSTVSAKNNENRNNIPKLQTKDFLKRKNKSMYVRTWTTETVFLFIKELFRVYVGKEV